MHWYTTCIQFRGASTFPPAATRAPMSTGIMKTDKMASYIQLSRDSIFHQHSPENAVFPPVINRPPLAHLLASSGGMSCRTAARTSATPACSMPHMHGWNNSSGTRNRMSSSLILQAMSISSNCWIILSRSQCCCECFAGPMWRSKWRVSDKEHIAGRMYKCMCTFVLSEVPAEYMLL